MRWFMRNFADSVISICQDNAVSVAGPEWEADPRWSHFSVVYNPIDWSRFNWCENVNPARALLEVPRDVPVVTFVGGSTASLKGVEDFILMLEKLYKKQPDVCGVIVGIKSWKPSTSRIASAWEYIKPKTRAIEFSDCVETWLAASDVVCVLHKTNHFSRTLLEAWAVGRPTISYDEGALSEIVHQSGGGIEVPSGQVTEVLIAVEMLCGSVELRRSYARSGHVWVQGACSPEAGASKVLDIYNRILE